jgi:hypothetical protein
MGDKFKNQCAHSEVLFDSAALGHLLPQRLKQQSQPVSAQQTGPSLVATAARGLPIGVTARLRKRFNTRDTAMNRQEHEKMAANSTSNVEEPDDSRTSSA